MRPWSKPQIMLTMSILFWPLCVFAQENFLIGVWTLTGGQTYFVFHEGGMRVSHLRPGQTAEIQNFVGTYQVNASQNVHFYGRTSALGNEVLNCRIVEPRIAECVSYHNPSLTVLIERTDLSEVHLRQLEAGHTEEARRAQAAQRAAEADRRALEYQRSLEYRRALEQQRAEEAQRARDAQGLQEAPNGQQGQGTQENQRSQESQPAAPDRRPRAMTDQELRNILRNIDTPRSRPAGAR